MERREFDVRNARQGDDGEWYDLKVLRALHRLGRLAWDTPGYRLLMSVLTPAERQAVMA